MTTPPEPQPVRIASSIEIGDDYFAVIVEPGEEVATSDSYSTVTDIDGNSVPAGQIQQWRRARQHLTDQAEPLAKAREALEAAERAFALAEQQWQAHVQEYRSKTEAALEDLIEQVKQAEQAEALAEQAEQDRQRRAEEARAEAALAAVEGPADFRVSYQHTKGRRTETVGATLHTKHCRFAPEPSLWRPEKDMLRARAAIDLYTSLRYRDGVTLCKVCKVGEAIMEVNPQIAEEFQAAQQTVQARPQHPGKRKVASLLEGVSTAFWVNPHSGAGVDGFKVDTHYQHGLAITWYQQGQGRSDIPNEEALKMAEHLIANGLHVTLDPSDRTDYRDRRYYRHVYTGGQSPSEQAEGLYASLDNALLLRALVLGLSTRECLGLARSGEFTEDAVATLAAFRAADPNARLLAV